MAHFNEKHPKFASLSFRLERTSLFGFAIFQTLHGGPALLFLAVSQLISGYPDVWSSRQM
jgi:hypothetical protein